MINPCPKEASVFAQAMANLILGAASLPLKGETADCLIRTLSVLEESLNDGGLCASIRPQDAQCLLDAGLAVRHSNLQQNSTTRRPIVLSDENNVYLLRDFEIELDLADRIGRLINNEKTDPSSDSFANSALFGLSADQALVRQLSMTSSFSVIYGGPGTGKTTCLAGILESLLESNPNLSIFLAAPTGKAASRMREALEASADKELPELSKRLAKSGLDGLPARTLHKWLLSLQGSGQQPSESNPLDCDVFVLDEASMLDARLAHRLFQMINLKRTRVIFLGDAYQLRSVGPGSVFADLCVLGRQHNFAAELKRSYRFDPDSGVGKMAYAVNKLARQANKDSEAVKSLPANKAAGIDQEPIRLFLVAAPEEQSQIPGLISSLGLHATDEGSLFQCKPQNPPAENGLSQEICEWIDKRIGAYACSLAAGNEECFLAESQRFRILCATRQGPCGVDAVNAYAKRRLKEKLSSIKEMPNPRAGEMIIITKNDDSLGLYNGDMGIILPAQDDDITRVVFSKGSEMRHVALSLLPEYETAFAITIHKSQGSEYEDVALVLPDKNAGPILSNELFYTGITRVKDIKDADGKIVRYGKLSIFASSSSLKTALTTFCQRKTGLRNRLAEVFEGTPSRV